MRQIYLYAIIFCLLTIANTLHAQTWSSVQAEKLYQKGLGEIKANRQDRAILTLEEAVRLNPQHVDAQVCLAKSYLRVRQYNQTIKTSQLVIKMSPRYEDVYYYIVGAYLSEKRSSEALKYTDLALGYFPANKDFAVKKLNILDLLKRFQDGDSWTQQLLRQYPSDVGVRQSVAGHYEAKADWYVQKNLEDFARANYERALELTPRNQDLIDKLNNLVAQGGDLNAKLARTNRELSRNSKSYTALYQKLGLLEEDKRYAEALDVLHTIMRYYPNDKKAILLNSSLRKEAAAHYQNTEAYSLYQSILDQSPNDKEALQKVIGMSVASGDISQALYRIDRALQREPGNLELLRQKMTLYFQTHRYQAAADIGSSLYKGNHDKVFRAEVLQTIVSCGGYYIQQQQADSALIYYNRALMLEPGNLAATNGRINAFIMKNNLGLALDEIDKAILLYPENTAMKIKKSSLLAKTGKIREAVKLSEQLFKQNPNTPEIRSLYLEQRLEAANACILSEHYDEAEHYLRQLLKEEPGNREALNYLSNMLDLQKRYKEALLTVDLAIKGNPEDKDFLQKRAAILYNDRQYLSAAKYSTILSDEYPFNVRYKQMAAEAWLAAGRDYSKRNLPDSALLSVDQAIAKMPADSAAMLLKTNILIGQKQFVLALSTTDEALGKFEYAESFLLRKTIILDSLRRYTEAANYADSLSRHYHTQKNNDYALLLRSKTLFNSFGLNLLNSSFSQTEGSGIPPSYNLASLDYNRIGTGKISYGGTLTFLGRQQGTGIMLDGNVSYKLTKKLYWNASLGVSNNNVILPKYRISYSLFPTFSNGLEGEVGARYFEVAGISVLSAITGVGKQFGPFNLNVKVFGLLQKGNPYFSASMLSSYELSNRDIIQANLGLGSSPDDINRLILFPQLYGILSHSIGAAYRRTFAYRTSIGLSGTYINQKITTDTYYNQYDLQFSLRVKF
ncbi:tetratricopeptide repeat protein [Pedobacter sp. WC2501]|uniref:tetratricopeptide repeat protein n=1 Tax=Pedobacter sp. WC2501 TaxID=3461400 RepID=UPI0040455D61